MTTKFQHVWVVRPAGIEPARLLRGTASQTVVYTCSTTAGKLPGWVGAHPGLETDCQGTMTLYAGPPRAKGGIHCRRTLRRSKRKESNPHQGVQSAVSCRWTTLRCLSAVLSWVARESDPALTVKSRLLRLGANNPLIHSLFSPIL